MPNDDKRKPENAEPRDLQEKPGKHGPAERIPDTPENIIRTLLMPPQEKTKSNFAPKGKQ